MQLSFQNFTTLVQGMAATVQGSATQLLNLTVGSTIRAILESSASVALWMQWLILQVLQMTRAATSNGPDLDSWMADFSLTRLAAAPASGLVTFARNSAQLAAVVPIGTLVRTADGTQTFSVTADANLPSWQAGSSSYLLGPGVGSLDIPVVAQEAGSAGNVQACTITLIATALAGIDSVVNPLAFTNGIDAESDSAFRLRFQTYLASLSRATLCAVSQAIGSVQQGLTYVIQENQNSAGMPQLGNFVVVVDDGSGYPASSLLAMVQTAVESVRPVGTTFSVIPPVVTEANVSFTVAVSSNSSIAGISSAIVKSLTSFVNSLPVGTSLPASRVIQLAYDASPNILNVTQTLLNGAFVDLCVPPTGVIKLGSVTVN